jgi:hypothetical protein
VDNYTVDVSHTAELHATHLKTSLHDFRCEVLAGFERAFGGLVLNKLNAPKHSNSLGFYKIL